MSQKIDRLPRVPEGYVCRSVARSLAVSARAFSSAADQDDDNGIAVWGQSLLDDQELSGIELHDPKLLKRMVAAARERMAAAKAKQEA